VGRRQQAKGRTRMMLATFTFKTEAVWMLIFSLAPAVIGLLVVLVVPSLRLLR